MISLLDNPSHLLPLLRCHYCTANAREKRIFGLKGVGYIDCGYLAVFALFVDNFLLKNWCFRYLSQYPLIIQAFVDNFFSAFIFHLLHQDIYTNIFSVLTMLF